MRFKSKLTCFACWTYWLHQLNSYGGLYFPNGYYRLLAHPHGLVPHDICSRDMISGLNLWLTVQTVKIYVSQAPPDFLSGARSFLWGSSSKQWRLVARPAFNALVYLQELVLVVPAKQNNTAWIETNESKCAIPSLSLALSLSLVRVDKRRRSFRTVQNLWACE